MKVIKEAIANIEKVLDSDINAVAEMPLAMADAVADSEKRDELIDDKYEKPSEMLKQKPFIGAEKQKVPTMPKRPKVELDESLFEEDDTYEEGNMNESSKEDYNIEYYQVYKNPSAPTENGTLIAQRGTEEAAKEAGDKLVGDGNYFIKAVCDDGKTRYLESLNEAISDFDILKSGRGFAVINFDGPYPTYAGAPCLSIEEARELVNNSDRERYIFTLIPHIDEDSLNEGRTGGNALWNSRDDTDTDPYDLWAMIYDELAMDSGATAKKRKISREEYKNSKRFRFDDELAWEENDGVKNPNVKYHKDRRNARILDNKFILDCKDEEQLNFAKAVAEAYNVPIEVSGMRAVITVPDEKIAGD